MLASCFSGYSSLTIPDTNLQREEKKRLVEVNAKWVKLKGLWEQGRKQIRHCPNTTISLHMGKTRSSVLPLTDTSFGGCFRNLVLVFFSLLSVQSLLWVLYVDCVGCHSFPFGVDYIEESLVDQRKHKKKGFSDLEMEDKMEENGDLRCWDELIPDALGLIFRNLSLQEILAVIPRVCKSWGKAVAGPYCWQEIDIEEWSRRSDPDQLDRMLQMLITRSCGSLRKLCVAGLPSDASFSFIADHAASLQTLRLPRSKVSDSIVEQMAGRLSNITFLDVSYCIKIGARALEAFGSHCKSLAALRRIMHPLEVVDKVCQDDEAHAIASTMPKLKCLEMAYLLLTTDGVLEILSNCRELEFLDVRGCWDVKFSKNFLNEKFPNLKVLGPLIVDCYERNYCDYCSDYSDSSDYLPWGMDDDGESSDGIWDFDQGLEELELRFYEEFGDPVATFDWPPSP